VISKSTSGEDVPQLEMSARRALTEFGTIGAYFPTYTVGTYAPPRDFFAPADYAGSILYRSPFSVANCAVPPFAETATG